MRRVAGLAVFAGSSAIGFKIGSFLPREQYSKFEYPETLQNHPYVARLLEQGWALDTHQPADVPSFHAKNMVMTGVLAGADKFLAAPLCLVKDKECQTIFWLGDALTHNSNQKQQASSWFGHSQPSQDPVVHNGMAVLMLDHSLAHTALKGGKRAMTKTLEADFKQNIKPGVVALKSQQLELRRRSASAAGHIYEVNGDELGRELVSGNVLMVRPKWAPTWLP